MEIIFYYVFKLRATKWGGFPIKGWWWWFSFPTNEYQKAQSIVLTNTALALFETLKVNFGVILIELRYMILSISWMMES